MSEPRPNPMPYPAQLEHLKAYMGELANARPETMRAFDALHAAAGAAGALDARTKELIALAIAVTARCDGCIAFHTSDALAAGATREDILDALGVAVLMGGGPAVVYATHVIEALSQFEAAVHD